MSLQKLDAATSALIALATAIALGDETLIEQHCRTCQALGAPETWVDELLLQSTLMVGWPRALIASAICRRVLGPAHWLEDGADYSRLPEWQQRGEAVCRTIYGDNYLRLRSNIQELHPALDAWMVTEGYGRTLGRPGLDLARRELTIVAQVAVQGAERQLHSHLRGALHSGTAPEALDSALAIVRPSLDPHARGVLDSVRQKVQAS
jgi:4-carboxymuconolactone decarboxylase